LLNCAATYLKSEILSFGTEIIWILGSIHSIVVCGQYDLVQISLLVLDNLFSICLGITMLQVLQVNWYAFQVYAQSIFYKAMNLHTSVVAWWEHLSGWDFIIFCPSSFFLVSFCIFCSFHL
jgi:hypothetical protein